MRDIHSWRINVTDLYIIAPTLFYVGEVRFLPIHGTFEFKRWSIEAIALRSIEDRLGSQSQPTFGINVITRSVEVVSSRDSQYFSFG